MGRPPVANYTGNDLKWFITQYSVVPIAARRALVDKRSIPDPHRRYVAIEAEHTERARIEHEMLPGLHRQSDPARGQDTQHVAMREQRNVALDGAGAGDHPVHANGDLFRRFPGRT